MAIVAMLVVARFYDRLPIHAPACGLLTTTGVPCMACGGTRSMMALAHGRIIEALAFNPLIFLGVIAAFAWAGTSLILWRFFPNRPSRARRLPIWVIVTGLTALFLANWVYLYFYLPR
ncbi:MAG: DUF2752 domain-containing protein [Verrucomicrobiae bacterium]|nr:DUF2752 domain-containing protein [Verrucomicrobiae bacterium]